MIILIIGNDINETTYLCTIINKLIKNSVVIHPKHFLDFKQTKIDMTKIAKFEMIDIQIFLMNQFIHKTMLEYLNSGIGTIIIDNYVYNIKKINELIMKMKFYDNKITHVIFDKKFFKKFVDNPIFINYFTFEFNNAKKYNKEFIDYIMNDNERIKIKTSWIDPNNYFYHCEKPEKDYLIANENVSILLKRLIRNFNQNEKNHSKENSTILKIIKTPSSENYVIFNNKDSTILFGFENKNIYKITNIKRIRNYIKTRFLFISLDKNKTDLFKKLTFKIVLLTNNIGFFLDVKELKFNFVSDTLDILIF